MITWRARAYKPCEAASSAVYLTNQAKSGTRRSPDLWASCLRYQSYSMEDAPSCRTLWVPKTIATWADSRGNASARGLCQVPAARSAPGRACDDFRLVGLKLIFLIVTRAVSLLSLSRREVWWKDAEILILRHQLAVTLREQPRAHARLTWSDRAWLAPLAGALPGGGLDGLRLIVAPSSILRLCVPRIASTVLTSRVARPALRP